MPKVTLTESQKKKTIIVSTIKKYAGAKLLSMPQLARRINIPKSTFNDRLNNPGNFRQHELEAICKILNVPEEERGRLL